MRPSRRLYRWSVFGALPGGLWMALELYGLTLRGPQPLFHWVIEHVLPLVLVVWLAIPIGAACLFQTLWGEGDWGRPIATRIYAQARPLYHPVTSGSVDQLVGRP